MHQMPGDWSQQIQAAYPKRSGPCGWGGMKLMLAVRRALMSTTWEAIMEGVERYAGYCQASGKTGTDYVLGPKTFFEEAIYAEELVYAAPKSKEEIARGELKAKEQERWKQAHVLGRALGMEPYPLESCAAFETRIRLAQTRMGGRIPDGGRGGDAPLPNRPGDAQMAGDLATRVSTLANRFRIAK